MLSAHRNITSAMGFPTVEPPDGKAVEQSWSEVAYFATNMDRRIRRLASSFSYVRGASVCLVETSEK